MYMRHAHGCNVEYVLFRGALNQVIFTVSLWVQIASLYWYHVL